MSNELKYYKVTRDDGDRYITSEQVTQNGDTVQRVYKEPASWSNAGQRGEYLESTFIRPKDWPTTGKRRQYYTPSGKGIDDPWFFEPGTQETFDQMWNKYEEYRRKMKNPQNKLPKLNRPDQVESKQEGGPFKQFTGNVKNLFNKDATAESKSASLDAISPHLQAIGDFGKSSAGAAFNIKTGNEGKFQEAQAIKEKNKVSLNPVMNFNNSASSSNIENNLSGFERGSGNSIDNAASVGAKAGSMFGPWGGLIHASNAPSFNKGGYLKLFKK